MAEMVRVIVGSKPPKFFPADENRKQALFVDVAENRQRFDREQQRYVDLEPRWYEAKFEGRDAELMRDQFQQGDALILVGDTEKRVRETADGNVYKSTRFYVQSFGIDPRLTTSTIDRSRRQHRTQEAAQTVEQGPAADAEADPAQLTSARTEVERRLHEVVNGRYIDGATAQTVMDAWNDPKVPAPELGASTVSALRAVGANEEVVGYVSSVADEYAGTGRALTWNEAAAAAQAPQAPAPTQDDWAVVNQVRHEIAEPAPLSPSM